VDIPINTNIYGVLTYDADATGNNPTLYLYNGQSVSTLTVGSGLTESTGPPTGTRTTDASSNLVIGNNTGQTTTHDGEIDDVAIHDAALSETYALRIVDSMLAGGAIRYGTITVPQTIENDGLTTKQAMTIDGIAP